MTTSVTAADLVSVLLPREILEGLIGDTRSLHGVDLRRSTGPVSRGPRSSPWQVDRTRPFGGAALK